ncbi:phosphoglycerate dehydrogenase [Pseudogracilibacillus auburnensis]|uniref:D-3-phosphoglycerate dehydrogenase n=1 Tax=Pseudogracilibacillus auburnensis TaxID=1494959 RepID=A0A2V3VW74_9BACI|nr:phosphoglycerate dehydrogenase [Pseudogracilibacillus auburnensis]PXW86232.1 D-3-phosphoglycerate dehydrogenase [Pseudogracilibacillus auburnensis]
MVFKILISDPLSEDGIFPLREADNIEVVIDTGLSKEELLNKIGDFDGLLVRSQTQVTREVIETGHNLKVIGRAGVGVDNIDLDAATENGMIVVNAPDGNTNSAAEHTMAMLMSLARNIPQAYLSIKDKKWDRKSYVGVELRDKTLGIVGLGRIGAEVARRAKGQRMNVIAYDPFFTKEKAEALGIEHGTLDEVLAVGDFITVHTPLLKETRHIINKEAFAKMKDGVRVINCARGGIINEDDLYDAIVEGKVAGAALDVFEEEPAVDHKVLNLKEVIATPHLGASTIEAQENVAIDVSHDVVRILSGGLARNPVNIPSVPREVMRKIEPYFYLSEKLGLFLAHLEEEVISEININYAGDLTALEIAPLTQNTLKGLLSRYLGSNVNNVNAAYLAERKGITIHEKKTSAARGFTNLITVEIITKSTKRRVSGTLLNGLGARIVKVDDYSMDVIPEGHLLLVHHKDQPGAIGRVGNLLAENDVNIATMQVGRLHIGGNAIMMLTIDRPLTKEELEQIRAMEGFDRVTAVDL